MNSEYTLHYSREQWRVNYVVDLGFKIFGKKPIWRRFTVIWLLCYKWITHWFLVNAAWQFRWIFGLWMPSCEVIFHDPKLGPERRLRSLSSTWIFSFILQDLLGFFSFYLSCFSSLLLIRDPVLLASDQYSMNLGLLFFFNESLLFPFLIYCSFSLFSIVHVNSGGAVVCKAYKLCFC